MAARKQAEVFGRIFSHLAENPDGRNKILARWLAEMSHDFDFTWQQMDCDRECLIKLELLRKGINPDYPYEGETYLFYGENGFDQATESNEIG